MYISLCLRHLIKVLNANPKTVSISKFIGSFRDIHFWIPISKPKHAERSKQWKLSFVPSKSRNRTNFPKPRLQHTDVYFFPKKQSLFFPRKELPKVSDLALGGRRAAGLHSSRAPFVSFFLSTTQMELSKSVLQTQRSLHLVSLGSSLFEHLLMVFRMKYETVGGMSRNFRLRDFSCLNFYIQHFGAPFKHQEAETGPR